MKLSPDRSDTISSAIREIGKKDHKASRNARETSAARPNALPPTPALCCDLCAWPMNASEIVRLPDGAIPGLLTCSLCVEDSLYALATRQLEPQTL